MQEIGGALSVGGSGEDGAPVIAQCLQQRADIVGMIGSDLRGDAEVADEMTG